MSTITEELEGLATRVRNLEQENTELRAQAAYSNAVNKAVESFYQDVRMAMERRVEGSSATEQAIPKRPGAGTRIRYTESQMQGWYTMVMSGLAVDAVVKQTGVPKITIMRGLRKIGMVCNCGLIIGTEEGGVIKGHDGICGYCREDKDQQGTRTRHEL